MYEAGVLVDPDATPTVQVQSDDNQAFIVPAGTLTTRDDLGLYSYALDSSHTQVKGDYTITWNYSVGGSPRIFVDHFKVTDPMPYWDLLTAHERGVVMNVYARVSDTWDSREGGPYLWELYQTHWNVFETIARIMTTEAMAYINWEFSPAFNPGYEVGVGAKMPFQEAWAGLLDEATYTMFLKHLSRSYIEIPAPQGVSTARVDRTHYRAEWKAEYQEEKAILDRMLKMFKRRFLVTTRSSLLLAGGRIPYLYANPAQPHWRYSIARF